MNDAASTPYWSQPAQSVLAALASTPDGLSTAQAERRLQRFGPNALQLRQSTTALGAFLKPVQESDRLAGDRVDAVFLQRPKR